MTHSVPFILASRPFRTPKKTFEMAAGISLVIEIQFRNSRLQKPPHGLAHIRSQPQQSQPSQIGRPRFAEIIFQKSIFLIAIKTIIGRQIAQVEEQISLAAIFPIQNPDPALVIYQVAGQQIVVAMAYAIGSARLVLDPCQNLQRPNDIWWKGDLPLARLL